MLKFVIEDLKIHSTLTANCTWSAFVPICRRRFNGDTALC